MSRPPESPPSALRVPSDRAPAYRSAAVAHMLRMPVSTLRNWERRYRVASPTTTPSGHRLYSAADIQRLALLKQLTDVGHAIGAIAALDMAALRCVAATHVSALHIAQPAADALVAWPVAVVGDGLARQLRRPELARRLGRQVEVSISFGSVADAAQASIRVPVEALLVQTAGLDSKWLPALQAAACALGTRRVLVCYGYGTEAAVDAFEGAGMVLARSVLSDRDLAKALYGLGAECAARSLAGPDDPPGLRGGRASPPQSAPIAGSSEPAGAVTWPRNTAAPPRDVVRPSGPPPLPRYSPATLADIASLSTTITCECPRHVTQLLTLLGEFETYSAECMQLSRNDAELHAFLQYAAGMARGLFEDALERLALHEGMMLPA